MQQQTQAPDAELKDVLRHPLVQKARVLWVERKRKKGTLTFEEWLVRLCDGMSITDIGRLDGTTRQAAQQTYEKYFRAIFEISGLARLKERADEKRTRDEDNLRAEVLKSEFRELAEIVQTLGFSLESCAKFAKNRVANPCKNRIRINGKLCGVLMATRPYTPRSEYGSSYARHVMTPQTLQGIAFLIFQVAIEGVIPRRYFVVPSEVLLEYGRGKKYFYVYIPIERTRPANSPARVDYRQFEDAWQLLATESLPRTPASW